MSNKYTNTITAAAYSLGVHPEVLQQSLEQMREISERVRTDKGPDLFVIGHIKVSIQKQNVPE